MMEDQKKVEIPEEFLILTLVTLVAKCSFYRLQTLFKIIG